MYIGSGEQRVWHSRAGVPRTRARRARRHAHGLDLFDDDTGQTEEMTTHQIDVHVYWLSPALTFVTVLTYFAFHEVARELEDPFLHPPNQLPFGALQTNFNTRLTASCAPRPAQSLRSFLPWRRSLPLCRKLLPIASACHVAPRPLTRW